MMSNYGFKKKISPGHVFEPPCTFPSSVGLYPCEVSHAAPACPYDKSRVKMKISMEHCWKDTDRGRPMYLEKYQYQCHFVYHKCHMNWPDIEPEPL